MKSKSKSDFLSVPHICAYVLTAVFFAFIYWLYGQFNLISWAVVSVICAGVPIAVTFIFEKLSNFAEAIFGISAVMNGSDGDEAT